MSLLRFGAMAGEAARRRRRPKARPRVRASTTIAMHPASAYAEDGTYSWPALVAAAQVRGDVALGYRADAPVVVNPSPDTVVVVGADTQLAVLTRSPLA